MAKLKIEKESYDIKLSKIDKDGTVYTIELEGKDFCVFESHKEKLEKEKGKDKKLK